jgi:hypothetical protein
MLRNVGGFEREAQEILAVYYISFTMLQHFISPHLPFCNRIGPNGKLALLRFSIAATRPLRQMMISEEISTAVPAVVDCANPPHWLDHLVCFSQENIYWLKESLRIAVSCLPSSLVNSASKLND